MSGIEEVARAVEHFTASAKERELRASRDSFRDGYKQCQTDLASARSTIAEQEKRIAELEAERDTLYSEGMDILNRWKKLIHVTGPAIIAKLEAAEAALTTERQRWKEAEALLQTLYDNTIEYIKINNLAGAENNYDLKLARAYFAKHNPSTTPGSTP